MSVQEETAESTDSQTAESSTDASADSAADTNETAADSSGSTEDSSDNTIKNGLYKENGSYYFYKNGEKVTNAFRTVNKKTYYFGKNGKNVTGYKKINGKYYYFKENGVMLKNSWQKVKGKKYYFTKNGTRAEGVTKIGKKYYYFSSEGIRMTGFFKDGNGYYLTNYANSKPNLVAYREGNKYYYANGKTMSAADKNEFYTMIRAYTIVQSITTKSMSMSEKRLAAFKWVIKKHYAIHRVWSFSRESWPAVYALDHFDNKGGDCHSDAAAFAYLAFVIGYKNVVVCTDYGTTSENNHAWCAIDGRMYDPLFAETKSFSTYYNGPHQYAWHEYKLPLLKASNASKSTSSKSSKKKSSSSSSSKTTGVVLKNGKFYYYSSSGKLNKTKTKKIRQAAKEGTDINELIKLIGEPNKRSYSGSCLIAGAQDGILKYDGFKVITLKTDDGETFVSAE